MNKERGLVVTLASLGFDGAGETPAGTVVARVVSEEMVTYRVRSADADAPKGAANGEYWADLAGKFRHTAQTREDVPAVGDFVAVKPPHSAESRGHIVKLFPRKSLIARTTERGELQPMAANVDTAFVASSVNNEFNLRRIERYLALVHKSGARPVVVLTKADLVDDPSPWVAEVKSIAPSVAVHPVSAVSNNGLDVLRTYLGPGKTVVLLGSSGVGKSTLTNWLAQADLQWMMEIREYDDKGRHCTSKRNLFVLSDNVGGGLLIDTPGLRGLSVTESTDALAATFEDVEALIPQCRFSDCQHQTEPGCAVKTAIDAGTLDAGRLEGYIKMQRELAYFRRTKEDLRQKKDSDKKRSKDYYDHKKKQR